MAKVDVKSPFCEQAEYVKKHSLGKVGHQRYRCQMCCRTFQLAYAARACQHGMKEQIVDLAMNSSGIRDTARALHISINAVVHTLKNARRAGCGLHGNPVSNTLLPMLLVAEAKRFSVSY